MAKMGLLIDYTFCSGCHTCILACQQEKGWAVGQDGIVLTEIGPRETPDSTPQKPVWEYDFVPVPTQLCDLCEDRVQGGKKPACVHHCQGACMSYGPVEELAKEMALCDRHMALYTVNAK